MAAHRTLYCQRNEIYTPFDPKPIMAFLQEILLRATTAFPYRIPAYTGVFHMQQFPSIEKLDTGILYLFELASSVSVLLLAFGLIAALPNVLTQGSVLTDNLIMQYIWAWTQCIAIDASVAGTIIRTFRY